MANITSVLPRKTESDHLIVGPECAIDHNNISLIQERLQMRLDLSEAGRIKQHCTGLRIHNAHADVVPCDWLVAMWRIRRRIALGCHRSESQAFGTNDFKSAALPDRDFVPVDPAVMLEDFEKRIAGA